MVFHLLALKRPEFSPEASTLTTLLPKGLTCNSTVKFPPPSYYDCKTSETGPSHEPKADKSYLKHNGVQKTGWGGANLIHCRNPKVQLPSDQSPYYMIGTHPGPLAAPPDEGKKHKMLTMSQAQYYIASLVSPF